MKASIIIPVYNKEKYVEKCLRSALNQTFDDFEVIAVEYLVANFLTITEKISGQHHLIHQGGLTMVHMSDNGDISDILHCCLP